MTLGAELLTFVEISVVIPRPLGIEPLPPTIAAAAAPTEATLAPRRAHGIAPRQSPPSRGGVPARSTPIEIGTKTEKGASLFTLKRAL